MSNNPINKELLVELRRKTFAGFGDCKKALEATNNNLEEAITWLRKQGIAKATSKFSGKSANEGKVWVAKDQDGAAILELNSETDFTAKSEPFVKLCAAICAQVLNAKVNCIEAIKELTLENGHTINSEILSLSSITGEKIDLKRINYVANDKNSSIAIYAHHTSKIATLIKFNKQLPDEDIKNIAIHTAVNNPLFISKETISEEWINNEKTVIESLFKKDEKNAAMYDKIFQSKLDKVIAENCLLTQPFLYDAKKTVEEILTSLGTTVEKVLYYEVGK